MTTKLLPAECDLLMELLRTPTAGPLETGPEGPPPRLWEAQRAYADAAATLGFVPIHHAAPHPDEVAGDLIPAPVQRAIRETPGFLDAQPSLVLRLGPPRPTWATVMFNVHLDTVARGGPCSFDGRRFAGRGAVDAKGPAVGLLSGVRAALEADQDLASRVTVLIQAVSGEEGGAMGTIGTRPLVRRGFVGRLNIFCEPTGLRYLPRATAATTALVEVQGRDAIDDRPERGHNATVLLGYLAQHLAQALPGLTDGGRVCIAGIHTGRLHNRVYGSGELLVNMSYESAGVGRRMEVAFADCLRAGLAAFGRDFSSVPALALTAADAASLTRLEWIKRGLPALAAGNGWGEAVLEGAGLQRWPDEQPAFTCDAIWMHDVADTFTAVLGPGDLAANQAHGPGEFAELSDLEDFAAAVGRVLNGFGGSRCPAGDRAC